MLMSGKLTLLTMVLLTDPPRFQAVEAAAVKQVLGLDKGSPMSVPLFQDLFGWSRFLAFPCDSDHRLVNFLKATTTTWCSSDL